MTWATKSLETFTVKEVFYCPICNALVYTEIRTELCRTTCHGCFSRLILRVTDSCATCSERLICLGIPQARIEPAGYTFKDMAHWYEPL